MGYFLHTGRLTSSTGRRSVLHTMSWPLTPQMKCLLPLMVKMCKIRCACFQKIASELITDLHCCRHCRWSKIKCILLQVLFSVRSPTITCTHSEASCTGGESVSSWTMSTSSWGEQSYATHSLPTAWPYTLVHVVKFYSLENGISTLISVELPCLHGVSEV